MNDCKTLGLAPSFGFGDRLGLATPGHVAAMVEEGAGIEAIFPQQSIREMARTDRMPQEVMDDALSGMRKSGWTNGTGADADHLKTFEDVDVTAAVGFTFYTIDPSDYVDDQADDYDEATLKEKFAAIRDDVSWIDQYRDKSFSLTTGGIVDLDDAACTKAAVKYGLAVNRAIAMADHIREVNEKAGRDFEIELSVDETEQPTTLAEHFIVAEACLSAGMELVSLAPRFIGDLEKGVDYKGDLHALQRSLDDHAAIAELIGPYKLSLHSGSDKLSMYAALARATGGQFHIKTAGTSYLEALRVVARHDEALFRRIVDFSRSRYDEDRRTYHVSARLSDVDSAAEIDDAAELEREYLECWSDVPEGAGFTKPGRQILHCTFGSALTDDELGPLVRDLLETHIETYTEVLREHFVRHLQALQHGMP
jgi:hypothetical protein